MKTFNQFLTEADGLSPSQLAGMKTLQALQKKDGTFPIVMGKSGLPITLTGVNVTTLYSLHLKKYISMKKVFIGGKVVGLKLLKRVK